MVVRGDLQSLSTICSRSAGMLMKKHAQGQEPESERQASEKHCLIEVSRQDEKPYAYAHGFSSRFSLAIFDFFRQAFQLIHELTDIGDGVAQWLFSRDIDSSHLCKLHRCFGAAGF